MEKVRGARVSVWECRGKKVQVVVRVDPVDAAGARERVLLTYGPQHIERARLDERLEAACFFLLAHSGAATIRKTTWKASTARKRPTVVGRSDITDDPLVSSRVSSPSFRRIISRGPRRDPEIDESASGARFVTLL